MRFSDEVYEKAFLLLFFSAWVVLGSCIFPLAAGLPERVFIAWVCVGVALQVAAIVPLAIVLWRENASRS